MRPVRLVIEVVSGPGAGRRIPLASTAMVIGRDPAAAIHLADPEVSRRHAVLDPRALRVRDLGSTNGTALDPLDGEPARPVGEPGLAWPDGAHLQVGSARLAVRDPQHREVAACEPDGAGGLLVNPAPRIRCGTEPSVIEYPPEPAPPPPVRPPWALIVLPMIVAVPIALLWRQPMFLVFGVLTPAITLGQYALERRWKAADHARALARHEQACREREAELAYRRRTAVRLRHDLAPDPATVADMAGGPHSEPGIRLWERRSGDPDLLGVRLGLADQPGDIAVRRDGRSQGVDLPMTPLSVDLGTCRVLGVCGPREAREALARSMFGQLAVWASPQLVRLRVLSGPHGPAWAWAADLPHGQAPTAGVAPAAGIRDVVLLDDAVALRRRPEVCAMLAAAEGAPAVICLAASRQELPAECSAVVELAGARWPGQPLAVLHRRGVPSLPFLPDLPDLGWAEQLATRLRTLRDATPAIGGPRLPASVRLLDLVDLDPARMAQGWLQPPEAGSMAAPLGIGGGRVWTVDLVRDGPHVLVAGTTGAGKSELLTTLVSSFAVHHDPQRLTFLLVDYKGGTAFGALAGLPHVAGVVTDLDAAGSRRALRSLHAELRRRERWLTGSGTQDPPARLVIVVDEFRVLAEEQPDLLAGLIRVATVGRGLGVHLLLATQRPSGVVSAEIRANTNLRIALRLRDRGDSEDVIEAPDAARFTSDQPGRAVARCGGDEPLPVQAAHLPGQDRDRLLLAVRTCAELIGSRPPDPPWLPPLPEQVPAGEVAAMPGPSTGLRIALADRPEQQRREVLAWDLARHGHLAVIGGPASGRTTLLRVVADAACRQAGDDGRPAPQVQVIDAGGGLADLADERAWPRVGTVADAADVERCGRLIRHLLATLPGRWVGDAQRSVPRIVLIVDGWESLAEIWSRTDHGRGVEDLIRLARDGRSAGIHLAVAGGRALLGGTLASVLTQRVLLRPADDGVALLTGIGSDALPGHWPAGRALWLDGAEPTQAQVVLPGTPDSAAGGAPGPSAGDPPLRLRPLPHRVDLDQLPPSAIGVGGDDAHPVGLDLDGAAGALICGQPGSGRTSALLAIARAVGGSGRCAVLVTASRAGTAVATPGAVLLNPNSGTDLARRAAAAITARPDAVLLLDTGWASMPGMEELAQNLLNGSSAAGLSSAGGLRVVVTATPAEAAVSYRGLLAAVRAMRCGLLLGPRGVGDAEALGVSLGPAPGGPPGRGVLVCEGRIAAVQIGRLPPTQNH